MPKTINELAREHDLSISTLHERRRVRGIAGRKIGRTLIFSAREVRSLLAVKPRGRPSKKRLRSARTPG